MKISKSISSLVIVSIIITACKKSDHPPVIPSTPGNTSTPGYTVYIAGIVNGYNFIDAVYWKDGVQVELAVNAYANCLAINGADVYVAGATYTNSTYKAPYRAAYWKNGQLSQLADTGMSRVNGITVNGADVYCTGSFQDYFVPSPLPDSAAYWKNGTRNTLTALSKGAGTAIHFFGSTLYVSGYTFDDFSHSAVVWRNGIASGFGDQTYIAAIGVSPVDTFFVGRKGNDAWYWTSRTEKKLAHNGYANCITVSGTDVYIGGGIIADTVSGTTQAGYWKNDVFIPLLAKSQSAVVNGIALAGTDVYAVGSGDGAYCWKNGELTELGLGGSATAVEVVKK